ncbi:hypothetical protein ACWGST_10310 [Agromyces sp. NPDC055520]
MNVQRIAAIAAISGAVLGGASIVALGAAAYDAGRPSAVASSASGAGDAGDRADGADPRATASTTTAGLGSVGQMPAEPGTGTMAADYNPYLDPLNDQYVAPEARSEWLGKQLVIRDCMRAAGFEYLEWQWWLGGSPQPKGLDFETSVLWTQALYGPDAANPSAGCAGVGNAAEAEARAAGHPLGASEPAADPALPTERQNWLDFQQLVRECMAEAGHEYLYWEWWNPAAQSAEPAGLSDDERAAWRLALDGNAGGGAAYRWEDAGCWGRAVHESGNDNMH